MLRPRHFSDDSCPCILTGLPPSSLVGTLLLISPDRGHTERCSGKGRRFAAYLLLDL